MKKIVFTLIILATALTTMAQATQPCIVKQYNGKLQKPPLAGVQVTVSNAGSTTSGNDGRFILTFRTLKPGDHVSLISAKKTGYEIFNMAAVEQWNISRNNTPFSLVLVKSDEFAQLKGKLTQTTTDSYRAKYEKAVSELEALKKNAKIKEDEYNQKLDELEQQYMESLNNIDTYIDQFARIDLSEVSAEEQRILDMVQNGQIDEAVKAWAELDALGKLLQEKRDYKQLSEDEQRIKEKKDEKQDNISRLTSTVRNQVATLKLAGGKENYEEITRILKQIALSDTTDLEAVKEYAKFAYSQGDFKEAERFYKICINICGGEELKRATFMGNLGLTYSVQNNFDQALQCYHEAIGICQSLLSNNNDEARRQLAITQINLGNLYKTMNEFTKSEECYLAALGILTELSGRVSDLYHRDLASCQNDLGVLYEKIGAFDKAEKQFLDALAIRMALFESDSITYREELETTQLNLGLVYGDLNNYDKAETYYLAALQNVTYLMKHNPDAYHEDMAKIKNNLGVMYYRKGNKEESLRCYLDAYQERQLLFERNPEAYRAKLATSQSNLGVVYTSLADYAKAEQFHVAALENRQILYQQHPDVYRSDLSASMNNLSTLYFKQKEYEKTESYLLSAQELKEEMFRRNPDASREEVAFGQDNLGYFYTSISNWKRAEEFYLKALDNYSILYRQQPDAYRVTLLNLHKDIGMMYIKASETAKAREQFQARLEMCTILFNANPDAYREDVAKMQYMVASLCADDLDLKDNYKEYLTKALSHFEKLSETEPQKYQAYLDDIHKRLEDIDKPKQQ